MSVTFPMNLPNVHGVREIELNPVYEYTTGLTRGGGNQVAKLAPTLWGVKVRTVPLSKDAYSEWTGWLDAQQNGMNTFKLWDFFNEYPRAYPNGFGSMVRAVGGGAFDGTCAVVSVNALNARELTLDGLPNGFVFSTRDYIGFTYGTTKRALHRVVYGGGGSASVGGVITVTVEPAVLPGWADGDVVELVRPYVVMQLTPDSVSYGVPSVDRSKLTIEFEAQQAFRLPV